MSKSDTNILLYADDMIVPVHNVFHLQDKINVLVKYFSLNNLKIYLDKSKVVVISAVKFELCKAKGVLG
jgi:hypothetical protein